MMYATMRRARGLAWIVALIALAAPVPEAVGDDRFAGRPLTEVLATCSRG
jgi:hypothetical protein